MDAVHDEAQARCLIASDGLDNKDARIECDGGGDGFPVMSHCYPFILCGLSTIHPMVLQQDAWLLSAAKELARRSKRGIIPRRPHHHDFFRLRPFAADDRVPGRDRLVSAGMTCTVVIK